MRLSKPNLFELTAVVASATAAASGSALTASNTVPNADLGQGANTIAGYAITSVTYAPNAASMVKAQLVSGGSWYSCSNTAGSIGCGTTSPQATAGAANSLNVVASQ